MTTKKTQYTVRTFNPAKEGAFTSVGELSKLKTYKSEKLPSFEEAMVYLFTSAAGVHSSVASVVEQKSSSNPMMTLIYPVSQMNDTTLFQNFDVVTLSMIAAEDAVDVAAREELTDMLSRWAEKCRVVACRGWRQSVVREVQLDSSNKVGYGNTALKAKVALGRTIFYSEDRVTIGGNNADAMIIEDLRSLKRAFRDAGYAVEITAKYDRLKKSFTV